MNDSYLVHVVTQYGALSPKAQKILAVLVNHGAGMTRNEIAYGIYQSRLYSHDLKLLNDLLRTGFIGAELRRRHNLEMERNPEYRWFVDNYNRVYGGNRRQLRWGKYDYVWEYWVNDNHHSILKKIINHSRK